MLHPRESTDSFIMFKGAAVRVVKLPGSHHFNGDYGRLAEEILKAADVG
jgi:type IV secretory pathway VirJ component